MPKLSAAVAPDQRLIRTIIWTSNTAQNVAVPVTLEYAAPDILREQNEQKRAKVIGVRKLTPAIDQAELHDAMQHEWQQILAERVVKIEGLTYRKLSYLVSLDLSAVQAAGGLDTPIALDTTDATPLPEEDKAQYPGVETKGQAARQEIVYLLKVCSNLRQFVETVIIDVGYFQDEDWSAAAKNS